MIKIRINTIQCLTPDEIDKDEMFLKKDGHKIWPKEKLYHRVDIGDLKEVGLTLNVEEGWNEIEVWDFDFVSPNDRLGVFKFMVDNTPGKYTTSMTLLEKNSTAIYKLYWEILDKMGASLYD